MNNNYVYSTFEKHKALTWKEIRQFNAWSAL